jgi:hypothetical protein
MSLWGIAASSDGVWVVGTFVNMTTDNNEALLLPTRVGRVWMVDAAPIPGTGKQHPRRHRGRRRPTVGDGTFDNGGSERLGYSHWPGW